MKKILGIALACLVLGLVAALVSTSVVAAAVEGNAVLKNPFMRLWNAIHGLQSQLSNIELIPGPEGPPGPEGLTGPAGSCSCTGEDYVSLEGFQSLAARVEALEDLFMPDCILDSDCDDNDPCTDQACDSLLGCVYTGNGLCSAGDGTGDGTGTGGTGSASGDIIITEIMYNPDAVTDTYGEWLELYNAGESIISLQGWQVSDYGTDNFIIQEELIMLPGEHLVLCKNSDSAINGGLGCDYQYSSFTLGNTADDIVVKTPSGSLVDAVSYDSAVEPWKSLNKAGYSLQLDPASYSSSENDYGISWCNAYESYGLGDYGTPGYQNSDCNAG